MKIAKNIFLLLILIFSVSEIKSADWQLLSDKYNGEHTIFLGDDGMIRGKVFIDKKSLIKHYFGHTATYVINFPEDRPLPFNSERYKKIPRNTMSVKFQLAFMFS
tara:strand:+ start:483 stop:797 length:315 start_codon:yes stop_codon:yes gene_type:complete